MCNMGWVLWTSTLTEISSRIWWVILANPPISSNSLQSWPEMTQPASISFPQLERSLFTRSSSTLSKFLASPEREPRATFAPVFVPEWIMPADPFASESRPARPCRPWHASNRHTGRLVEKMPVMVSGAACHRLGRADSFYTEAFWMLKKWCTQNENVPLSEPSKVEEACPCCPNMCRWYCGAVFRVGTVAELHPEC